MFRLARWRLAERHAEHAKIFLVDRCHQFVGGFGVRYLHELLVQRDRIAISRLRLCVINHFVRCSGRHCTCQMIWLCLNWLQALGIAKSGGKRLQIMGLEARRIGIGNILRQQRLPTINPAQPLLSKIKYPDALWIHAASLRRGIESPVNPMRGRCDKGSVIALRFNVDDVG